MNVSFLFPLRLSSRAETGDKTVSSVNFIEEADTDHYGWRGSVPVFPSVPDSMQMESGLQCSEFGSVFLEIAEGFRSLQMSLFVCFLVV